MTKLFLRFSFSLLCAFSVGACGGPVDTSTGTQVGSSKAAADTQQRIVSLSGSATEALFQLGLGDQIVGLDVTSTYPAESVASLPKLGHVRQLNVEGVLSLNPTLIVLEESDAASSAISMLEEAGLEVIRLPAEDTMDKALAQAKILAQRLGAEQELKEIEAAHRQKQQQLQQMLSAQEDGYRPKVLFIYARGKGSLQVAGKDTAAEVMIDLAGGQNAVTSFEGFRALSTEGLLQAQPDVLLLFASGLESLGGPAGLLAMPGVAQTPAGQHQRIVAMDGLYLLGFTLRAPEAAAELAKALQAFDYDKSEVIGMVQ